MKRLSILASMTAVAALVLIPAASTTGATLPVGETPTIHIKGSKKTPLKFVGPSTIVAGEDLRIVNDTSAKAIGPHTFSLVEEALRPKSAKDRKQCFTPKHICKAIADWHGVKGEGPVTKNPAKAGKAGWDTEGSLSATGDSWFTGSKKGASFTQEVSVAATSTPTELHFVCAIHPWMQGSIEVLPGL